MAWVTRARLLHPFPSLLDGVVVGVVAVVAGAAVPLAVHLGLSMTLLQFAIGAGNDLADADRDADRTDKPLPAGLVRLDVAHWIAGVCGALGLVLALLVSPLVLAVAAVALAIGAAYNLRAKGTAYSWVPLAAGVPLLPVYGWLGAAGVLPALFLVLVPLAATAGAALAIANAVVDVERDAAAGSTSIAGVLGLQRAAGIALVLQLVVAGLGLLVGAGVGTPGGWQLAVAGAAVVPVGGALFGVLAVRRHEAVADRAVADRAVADRKLAWETQAVGLGLLAVAWISGLGAALGPGLGG